MGTMIEASFAPTRGRQLGALREQAQTTPRQIGVGLTLEQQRKVVQQMVSMCCHLAEESSSQREEGDEQR